MKNKLDKNEITILESLVAMFVIVLALYQFKNIWNNEAINTPNLDINDALNKDLENFKQDFIKSQSRFSSNYGAAA
jgi:hypothetical protein